MFRSFSCPMVGEREPITISYQGPLLYPHPPCGPSFVLLHLYPAPQHVGFRVWYWTGAVGYFWHYRIGAMQDRGYELLTADCVEIDLPKPCLYERWSKSCSRILGKHRLIGSTVLKSAVRIHLLRTPVNKSKEKGQSYRCQISPTSSQTAPPHVW